jgi:presenilin-like A22 family membrane protease
MTPEDLYDPDEEDNGASTENNKEHESSEKPRPASHGKTKENLTPIFVMVILFIVSIGFSLLLAPVFVSLNLQADFSEFGGEESLIIPFFYLAVILIFTAVILFITRKRKGRFIKYGFLFVIAISLGYVFYAIFFALFFPIVDQEWTGDAELTGDVLTIQVADIFGDDRDEIILLTDDGSVSVYDGDLEMLWRNGQPLSGSLNDLAVIDITNDGLQEIIVLGADLYVFQMNSTQNNLIYDLSWSNQDTDANEEYWHSGFILNLTSNGTGISRDNYDLYLTSGNPSTNQWKIERLEYKDNTFELVPIYQSNSRIFSFTSGTIEGSKALLYLGTNEGIFSIDPEVLDNTLIEIINGSDLKGTVLGLQIYDIDNEGPDEIIAWTDEGDIYIIKDSKIKKHIKDFHGDKIGGVHAIDFIDWLDDDQLIISSEGKVYIYYTNRDLLDERFEFTEDTGKLDKSAKGLSSGYIDDNADMDIVIGHPEGFKLYEYQSPVYSDTPCFMGIIVAAILSILLFKYPEWYLVDLIGIFVAAGVTALLGVSIALLPLIVLLIIFAVYDAISVYKTKHMVSLADKVMEFKLPVLLVVPKKRGYSFIQQKGLKQQLDDGEEREAMFIGLGDIIIPGTLVISSFTFLPVEVGWLGLGTNLWVAILTLVGILGGFSVLMQFVLKGNPQAGLPLLNTGAILGFVVSYILVYQDFTFGMSLPFG